MLLRWKRWFADGISVPSGEADHFVLNLSNGAKTGPPGFTIPAGP